MPGTQMWLNDNHSMHLPLEVMSVTVRVLECLMGFAVAPQLEGQIFPTPGYMRWQEKEAPEARKDFWHEGKSQRLEHFRMMAPAIYTC